jgi:predicted CXXCH cytochrome family protein
VECTSCHDPHLGSSRTLQKHERRDACISCHLEYRGPYTYAHEGDDRLACMSCHEPHGSGNRRILTYSDSLTLCISCHPLLEDHDLAYPIWQDCLNCHTEVHGSRWDRALLR